MREIYMGAGGLKNPDADLRCGVKDSAERFPQAVHWGGCRECAKIIKQILTAMKIAVRPPKPPEQKEFEW